MYIVSIEKKPEKFKSRTWSAF